MATKMIQLKLKTIFFVLSSLLLASCSNDDEQSIPLPANEQIRFEIGFDGQGGMQSRATTAPDFSADWEANDQIGLFIVKGNGGLQSSGNWIDNLPMTYSGGTWTYTLPSGKEYYPNDGDKLHFYAYYPYKSGIDPIAYTFSVETDQSDGADYNASDLLLAKRDDVANSSNAVSLQFSHALSLIQVEVKREVNVPFFNEADFTVTLTNVLPDAVLGWGSPLSGTGTAAEIVMHKVDGMTNTYRALVPAQTLGTDSKVIFKQTTSGKEINMTYPGVASTALDAAAAHKYSVTLGWGINPDHVYNIGDVYPHVGPAVGVVFWLDPADATKGKVVSLDEGNTNDNGIEWGPFNSTTNANDQSDGFVNMAKIKSLGAVFSNYPAFAWVNSKNPSGTDYSTVTPGIWYLPAREELKALFACFSGKVYEDISGWGDGDDMPGYNLPEAAAARTAFNTFLASAGGTTFETVERFYYWSSTEDDSSYAWSVAFDNGSTKKYSKTLQFRTRAVLAF